MLNERTVAVVVPCYNEENQIRSVIESMPEFVDRIIVVNDKSRDETGNQVAELVNNANKEVILPLGDDVPRDSVGPLRAGSGVSRSSYDRAERVAARMVSHEKTKFIPFELVCRDIKKDRLILVNHLQNGGVGAAIASGYRLASELGIYCTAVMAGDGQMDPNELEKICMPVINDEVDYVKGNRLIHRSAWLVIPKLRYLGNSVLSILTKIASGYWRVSDTQTGYTAISIKALKAIRLHKIYRRYGMPNDMLVKLNIAFCTIREVEIKPVYNVGEKSKMNIFKVIPKISLLLIKSFFKRLWVKYFLRDFHPLFLFYNFSFLLLVVSIRYLVKILQHFFFNADLSQATILMFMFLFIAGFQSLGFAMWMDILDNEHLDK